jgi:hypothetical protein
MHTSFLRECVHDLDYLPTAKLIVVSTANMTCLNWSGVVLHSHSVFIFIPQMQQGALVHLLFKTMYHQVGSHNLFHPNHIADFVVW